MTTAERIAEEIFRTIERERRILKADLVEAAERILKMEAAPIVCKKFDTSTLGDLMKPGQIVVTSGGGAGGGNAVQPNQVPFLYANWTNWHGNI